PHRRARDLRRARRHHADMGARPRRARRARPGRGPARGRPAPRPPAVKLLEARARALASAREFLASRGYLEVETPIAVPSPGLDLHLDAFEVVPTGVPAAEGRPKRYLSTSPEYQMKRLLSQ